jgi:HEAT repeat protein
VFKQPSQGFLVLGVFLLSLGLCAIPSGITVAEEPVQAGKTLEQWRQTLKAADPSLRWQAAEALGQLGQRYPRLVVRALSQAVGDEDLDVRLQAVASLAILGQHAEPAVPALGTALQDKDSDLRRQAALALAGVGPSAEETVAILGRTLHDPNANVRLAALGALQAIGPDAARATDDLLAGLKDKVPSVRRASAAALATIAPQADPKRIEATVPALAAALQDTDPEVCQRAAVALGAIGPRAEPATAALGETSRMVQSPARHEAALALGRIGGKAVAELAHNLEHAEATVRASAAVGLQLLGYRARPAFAALCKTLTDKNPAVRAQVRTALRASDPEPKDIVPTLKLSLGDKDDVAGRLWAILWLGDIATGIDKQQTEDAVALLSAALADGEAAIRRQAALALGNVGDEASSALKALRERVGDADASVRLQAAIALGKIDPQAARDAIPILLEALPAGPRGNRGDRGGDPFNRDVAMALAAIGAVEPLVEALEKSNDEGTRAGVIFALVRMGAKAKGAFKHLQGALQNRDAGVRQRSADAMHAILPDPKEAVPVLVESLQHEDDYIRRWAAAFLAELGERAEGPEIGNALEPLNNALKKETTSDVRAHMIQALGEIVAHLKESPQPPLDQELIRALIARLEDVNSEVRHEATMSLGKIGAAWKGRGPIREAIPPLLEALAKGRPFLAEAATALAQIGHLPPLIEAMKSAKNEKVRAGAAHAIQLIGPEAVAYVPALMDAMKDEAPHVRHEAVLALGAIGRPASAAVPALIGALDDVDYVVPPGAAMVLGQLGPEAEEAAPALCKALGSPAYELRVQAQFALVAIGPASVPSLRETLKSKEPTVLILAAQAIARIGPKARSAIPELLLAFGQVDQTVKHTAAEAVALFEPRTPDAIPALTFAVGHFDIRVATAAVRSLQELKAGTPAIVSALVARLENRGAYAGAIELHKLIVRTLGKLGPIARSAAPVLIEALDVLDLLEDASQALRIILAPNARGPALLKALKDSDQLDDRQIAFVLGSADAEAVHALIELLGHKKVRVRAAAALSLGRLGAQAKDSQPSLIKALEDGNRQVRLNAINALTQQATGPSEAGKAHKSVLAALEETLAHWDETTRFEAALRMAQIAVKEPLQKADILKTDLSAKVLIEWLKKEADPARRQILIDALNGLASIRTDLHLAQEMKAEDILAREHIAIALGAIASAQDNEAGVASLSQALGDRHIALRRQAAQSLGRLAQSGAIELKPALQKATAALDSAVRERDRAVRLSAAIALWRITQKSDKTLPVLLHELEFIAFDDGETIEKLRGGKLPIPALVELVSMAEQDEPARKALAAAFKHPNERVRAGAAVVVGSMKKRDANLFAQPLANALADRDFESRLQATVALRWLELNERQQEEVIPRLTRLTEDRFGGVRLQALITLGVVGPHSELVKLDRLQESLKDRDSNIRARTVEALGRFGSRAEKVVLDIERALKDQDVIVRHLAAASLGQIGAASLPALKTALADKDFDVRKHAILALGDMGIAARDALPALLKALDDKDEDVAAAAAEAVKKVDTGKIP